MTKYEQLARLAAAESEALFFEKERCERAARQILDRLTEFLGAPLEAISFRRLDADLALTNEVDSLEPNLVHGDDERWYFAVNLHLEGAQTFENVTLLMSLSADAEGVFVDYGREFKLEPGDQAALQGFAAYIHETLLEDYSRPRSARRAKMGFLPQG